MAWSVQLFRWCIRAQMRLSIRLSALFADHTGGVKAGVAVVIEVRERLRQSSRLETKHIEFIDTCYPWGEKTV